MYACIAATNERARCRNFMKTAGEICDFHKKKKRAGEEILVAPKPDSVLLRFNLNPNWRNRFIELGIPEKPLLSSEKEDMHRQQAERLGRQPYRFGDIAGSGTPVFGPEGIISGVSIYELLKEFLGAEGYKITDVHLRPRGNKKMSVLVINLSLQLEEGKRFSLSEEALLELLEFLSASCWNYCHVWANPPAEDGRVIHTVNSSYRDPQKRPNFRLRFASGLWAAECI